MRLSTVIAFLPFAMAAPAKRSSPAPVIKARDQEVVKGKFIVKMKGGEINASAVKAKVKAAVDGIAADPDFEYTGSFNGFAAKLTDDELAELQDNPDVDYIEEDAVVSIKATVSQSGATWGIARLSSSGTGSTTFTYDSTAGEGTCAFVVDTGIYTSHSDFGGRASFAANFVDSSNTDGQGHGTHVAGTIGSATYGVAKKTKLYAVKVLDNNGEGTNAGVIAGMNYVTNSAGSFSCPKGVVVNMSLGGGKSTSVNAAAAGIVKAGYFLAVAAGNDADNAANWSPASESTACTVGATTSSDAWAYYSNYGSLVDILAPGSSITSTYNNGRTASLSGTSMASPHVAGLAAYFLGLGSTTASNACSYIVSKAVSNAISGVPSGTVNKLAHL